MKTPPATSLQLPSSSPKTSSQPPSVSTSDPFLDWWKALNEDDRATFVGLGGDEVLARFVHSYETQGGTPVEAYARAFGLDPRSNTAALGVAQVWKHDAVIDLLGQLRYRGKQQAAARITARTSRLIESTLEIAEQGESVRDRTDAIKASLSFVKMVNEEDIKERIERIRRGVARGAGAVIEGEFEVDEAPLSPDSAVIQLRMLIGQYGEEGMKKLLKEARD